MNRIFTFRLTGISFLLCYFIVLFGQSAVSAQVPGGIGTGLNLWLDASDGTIVTGNNLTSWTDKASINTFTISATPPTVTANTINFHPTVDFNNTTSTDTYPASQSLLGNTAINYTDGYAVFKINDGNGGVIVGGTVPGSSYGKAVFAEFNSGIYTGNGDPITYSSFPFTDFNNFHVFGMDTGLSGNMIGRLDGNDQAMTNSTGFSSMSFIPTIGTTNNNNNLAGWNHLNGQVAEVILYDQSTSLQRTNIESYLAIKYGIHKAGNYVDSNNTVLWDVSLNNTYHNDVFGIGQDAGSGLTQPRSNSMNTGSGDGTGQVGKGNIVISNPSALVNNSFVIVGHDTADLLLSNTNIPAGNPNLSRINRAWKVGVTNNLGTVTLQFDASSLTYSSVNSSDSYLLIDTDGDGDFTTGTIDQILGTKNGSIFQFDNVTLPNNAVFTFATNIIPVGPVGIATNLRLWLKANSNVTPATQGAAVTNWADQSGGGNNATYTTPIYTQTVLNPTYQSNALNFNPTVRFAGTGNTSFASIGGTLTPSITSNNISCYTVFLTNSNSSATARAMLISQTSTTSDWQGQASVSLLSRTGTTNVTSFRNSTQGPTVGPILGTTVIVSSHFTAANQWRSEINGNSFTTTSYTTNALNSGYYRLGLSTYSANDWFNGDIAEVLLYDADQSSLPSHNQIESYLAVKYGIHKVGSYVNSSGTTIWDATANSTYHNDVFGIGQDDTTSLLQVQSNSLNTGSGDGTGQSAKGNIVISNPSSLVNNSFVMIGHDTGSLVEIDVNIAGNVTKRVQRLWKVQSTGNPGTVTLSYDTTGLTYTGVAASDYTILVDPTGTGNFSTDDVKQYPASAIVGNKISFNTVNLPTGAVFSIQTSFTAVNPLVQATNVTFTGTTTTATTANWVNGDGALREVFVLAGSTGSPVPVNNTTYTANSVFGTGTQIGTTGWYSVYKGTGTTVNITGLTPGTTYQVMAVEYNGIPGSEVYLSTVSIGNPAGFTTLNNIATLSNLTISEGTLDPVFDTGTTSYIATVPNAVTSLTVTPTTTDTNATVTVNGLTVVSGSASGAIALVVGPNIITTVVTAQDGTTIETYTITVTRTEPTIVTTGTLSALTTIYGTPSVSGTFNVSGTDMAEGILVTAPTGFEVSSDDLTFTNSVTIGAAGTIASTPVYIRLKGTIPAGTYSGDIVLTSNNATTVNVATVSSTVTPAALTITADDKTKMYGDDNPTLTLTYSGFVNGDTVGSLTLAPITSAAAVTGSPVGDYTISVSGAANPNYTISYVDGTLTITKALLTITADDQTKVYGTANPALTASYSGFVNGDTATNLTTAPTISTTALDTSPVGTYTITASGAVSDNYDFTYVNGTLTITKATLTITADDQTKVYGAANPTLTASYSGFANGETSASLTTLPTISTTALDASPVGTYAITASGAVSDNYDFTYVNGTLTITKATLTITADDQTKVYGAANPTLTASYSGFANGETSASLTTLPTISTTALDASPVGTYTITASGAVSDNYDFTYVNGTLTITKALLTITADDQTKVYGSANPTLTVSYSGFVNGDTATNLTTAPTISTTALDTSPVGTYTITASGAVSDNYDITYLNGTLTITKALLTITADDKNKVYGTVNPTLTASYLGFVNGDTAASLITAPTITTTALDTSPVGTYTITASGAVSDNYDFTYVNGNLTITKALLTITADDQTKVYGAVNPALTASYSGFVNGETSASLTTAPTIITTALDTSPVGTYAITASGAVSDNYDFTYVNGNLTITKALLTITADDKTKVYGTANPTLTASYSGFVNGDTATNLTTAPTISTTALDASPVGTYTITASGAVSDNYDFTYVNGNLAITKALLTITADDKTKVYGTANPTLTASYSGFVNGDTATNLTTAPTISTTALDASPVGTYTITASGAVSDNYDFTYVNGTLTITKALLTITADDKTKVYGTANPALTASYLGFVNGDTSSSLITPPTITTTALDASPVGTYTITASGAVSDNYDFTYVNGNLTITKATLTITADDQTKVYGTANPTLTASYLGFVNGDTATNLITPPTITTTALDASPVGTYTITASGAVSDNYDFTYVNGNLTITKALLTITADDQTKVYGTANPALTASYLGFVNGDTATNLTTAPTITTTALDASPVGTYTITASGAVSDNYDFTYVNGNLTITKATLTITADDKNKVYGTVNPTLTASYLGFVNGDTAASLITAPTITTTALDTSPVGTYTITASGAVSDNYDFTYVNGNLTITKATLTITADNQTKVYGEVNPALTASYLGFVNGDTAASLITPPTISTTALDASPVGTYAITASGAVSDNYDFTYVNGNLIITKALLTITADDQTKVYGAVNPALTASYLGFVNGDTAANLTTPPTISTTALDASPVGTYAITASGAVSDNYDFTYVNGNLTITKATLTITADDKTKVYGSANPALTASYLGFVNGDTSASLTTLPTITTIADATSPVGTYAITASGAVSDNYDFTYVNGNLTITKALLTITADDQTKVYGAVNPALTASYLGFVNGDTSASLITLPTITTIADATSPVGTYTITASGAVSDNYDFTYVNGTLTITKATLTITADDQTKVYGEVNPTLTASYLGFVNGDTATNLTTAPTITTTALDASPVGTYTITASGAVSDNYDFTYVNGTLTITKATLTITADDKTKVYGEVNPTLTASYLGFVNGDTSASLATLPTISTIADDTSPVGTYAITVSGAASDNYTINYVDGTLTITGATLLTIIANNQSKIYGEANPILTVSYVGFVNGDTEASLTTLPTITTTAVQSSPVGTYLITASGAVNPNYTISYVPGVLTVTPANLAIAADDKTKIYGEANPTLTLNYTGFVNGDTEANLLTPAIASTTADAASPVGSYPITISGATSLNYTIGYTSGATLTVTPANLAIAADDKFKIYGEANPPLTINYTGFVNGDTEASLLTPAIASTTADVTSPVGSYPITISGATSLNYTIGYTSGATLTVTPANLAIAADDKFKIYGEANPPLTLNYTGFVNGDTEASLLTPAIASTTADATSPVGSYPITISGATSLNYTIGYTSGATLTVTPANLAIAADDKFKIYGEANPPLTINYTGFVNGDTEASLLTPAIASTTADVTSSVGSYPITISGATSLNYTIGYTSGATLTVTPANLAIAADDKTKIYGEANPPLTINYTGFVNGDTEASLLTPAIASTTADATSPVGSYPITISGATSLNYTIGYTSGATLTVTPANLTITADNQSKTYGSVNPTLTASYSGFVNGDTAASFTVLPTISTIADVTSPVGTYPITASGAVIPNYAINYVDGTLTITTATLTITADNQSKTYGSVNPTLTATYSGFVNGDTAASFTTLPTITTTAVTGSSVGNYPITASGAVNPNYAINYVDGNLTVTTATLTITADNQTKTYGSVNPTLTATYSGFVNGDTASSFITLPTISTTAVTGSTVGSYPITASGAVNPNYVINYVDGTLTITTATLTITADNQTKTYGSVNPTLTASYSGFVNGDTAASFTTLPTITTTAVTGSNVGTYPTTASGAVNPNYTITYVDGTLTITTATLTITADNQTKTYGSANPTLTASYSGFVNGDTASSFTTLPTISTTAVTGSSVGTYPLTASGAVIPNYAINYIDGTLTITTATLTITADNQSKTYGSVNPTLTATYSGFVNGDTASSFTTLPTISTTAVTGSNVGTYPITASGAVIPNYTIAYVDGTLTVTTATLTITADNQTKTYGSVNPTLTASYSGFVNGDTASSFTTLPTIATTAVTGSNVGSYPITASGAVNPNYTISYFNGTLTVTTASLTITADNKTRDYGAPNPVLTANYSGFVNGDTSASLTTQPIIATIANATSPVGVYAITVSGAVDSNYSITYVTGILTVISSTIFSDADLSSLTVNNGTLNPAFSPNVLSYTVNVASTISSETITAIADDPLATITINGITVQSGSPYTIALVPGQNTVVIRVVGEDGITTKNYTLNIIREKSGIATLSNLTISEGALNPVFESDINNYSAVVKYDVASINVRPTATDLGSKITVNGLPVSSGTFSAPVTLIAGENIIETIVTAQDGITKETYTIILYKGISPDQLVINNILSPNGDGKNDFWVIKDIELFPNNVVTVYDRAGRIVYSKKSYSNEWDGSYSGSPLNNDTYYYLIDLGDNLPKIKGFITMLRD